MILPFSLYSDYGLQYLSFEFANLTGQILQMILKGFNPFQNSRPAKF